MLIISQNLLKKVVQLNIPKLAGGEILIQHCYGAQLINKYSM